MIRSKNNRNNLASSQRIYILTAVIFILGGLILARLYVLQVVAHQKYTTLAVNQHRAFSKLIAKRGEIYLQNEDEKYPLAVNREYAMIYLEPKRVVDKEKVCNELSEILEIERKEISEKLINENSMFKIVKHKASQEEVDRIKALNLVGVKIASETFRYYPAGRLASQVVGFVGGGEKMKGRYGLEAFWEKELAGINGEISQERDGVGRWISITDREMVPAQDGVDLVLTINQAVQYEVEKILQETIEKHQADGGSIVVQEPTTGKILAIANYPDFNPNEFGKVEDMSNFMNTAILTTYEPGSVFKAITLAAGIDSGVISPETTYTDTGLVREAGYNIKNSDEKAHGTQTMTQVLEKSLNTGVIFVEKLIGNKQFANYVRKFGFGEKTGVELPSEAKGNIRNLKNHRRNIEFFTVAYGQGITATPLQLAASYSTIANGGELMRSQVVDKVIYPDGREEKIMPERIRRVIKEDTAEKMREMLASVVTNGHGKRAAVEGYAVGGKTGTAQVAKQGGGGYEDNFTIGSFVGIAPVENPQFTVVVKIINPKDVIWAESVAAPAFARVMKFLLNYYNVEPSKF